MVRHLNHLQIQQQMNQAFHLNSFHLLAYLVVIPRFQQLHHHYSIYFSFHVSSTKYRLSSTLFVLPFSILIIFSPPKIPAISSIFIHVLSTSCALHPLFFFITQPAYATFTSLIVLSSIAISINMQHFASVMLIIDQLELFTMLFTFQRLLSQLAEIQQLVLLAVIIKVLIVIKLKLRPLSYFRSY